jgi:hypothetical protein
VPLTKELKADALEKLLLKLRSELLGGFQQQA